jgi:hypothetical protein
MSELDRAQMARILGLLGSDYPNERDTAARMAEKLRRDAGVAWADIIAPPANNNTAVEAARVLLAENEALRAELEELRGKAPDWEPVAVPVGSHAAAAQWALNTYGAGGIYLSDFEINFLTTCARWRGPLTPKQGPVFQQIVDRIYQRSGKRPPV